MSYGQAAALQQAIFDHLANDAALTSLIGEAVFDEPPQGDLPPVYVVLGSEESQDRSDCSGAGALHRFMISVMTSNAGFLDAKHTAGAVSDALSGQNLPLVRGRMAGLFFERARARRIGDGQNRLIEMIFRARLEDTE